jgi:endonuclease/exonuclease/phosphatase family metal-dependent hydrolase
VKNLDVSLIQVSDYPAGIPFFISYSPGSLNTMILNTIDRDVILVRNDIPARAVDFSGVCPNRISIDGCNYHVVVKAPILGGPSDGLPIERGFVAADVKVKEKNYRIVNTHLELREPDPTNPLSRFIQAAQAEELIQTLQATTPMGKSVLVLGDMNSSPNDLEINGITPPYLQFVDSGYTDAWTLRRHVTPGHTCCQAEDLLNKPSELYERIDYIFSKQETWGENVHLVGIRKSDKTLPPLVQLWPSDHAGVVGELHFWE